MWLDLDLNARLVFKSRASTEVNTALQLEHARRLQILLVRFWCRELLTVSFEPQYTHTMSIYCHTAINNASG